MPTRINSNCLFFALKKVRTEGGYLLMRRSHVGWWPHFVWSKDLTTLEEFVPTKPPSARLLPPLFFEGYVREALVGSNGSGGRDNSVSVHKRLVWDAAGNYMPAE